MSKLTSISLLKKYIALFIRRLANRILQVGFNKPAVLNYVDF